MPKKPIEPWERPAPKKNLTKKLTPQKQSQSKSRRDQSRTKISEFGG
jgi:hypothetical protein